MLVTTDPSSPDDKYPFVILWRSRYRLPSTAHSFDLFSVFKACARILPKAIFARNRTEPISNQRCVAKEHDETIHHQSNTSSVDIFEAYELGLLATWETPDGLICVPATTRPACP